MTLSDHYSNVNKHKYLHHALHLVSLAHVCTYTPGKYENTLECLLTISEAGSCHGENEQTLEQEHSLSNYKIFAVYTPSSIAAKGVLYMGIYGGL